MTPTHLKGPPVELDLVAILADPSRPERTLGAQGFALLFRGIRTLTFQRQRAGRRERVTLRYHGIGSSLATSIGSIETSST